MARITVEDCLTRETNRFGLVQLASKRTKQLLRGSKPLVDETRNKAVVTSLREIAGGKVRFMTDEELAREKELRRQREEELLAQRQRMEKEDVIGKDLFHEDAEPGDDSASDSDGSSASVSDDSDESKHEDDLAAGNGSKLI
jgi:DNA-directed RNA polymerase subunit omega